MKLLIVALAMVSASVSFADSESYPAPLPTGVYGTSRPSTNPSAQTGSEAYGQQAPQVTTYQAADCRGGVDQRTGKDLIVCRNGANN